MDIVLFFLKLTALGVIDVLQLAMLARVIFSLFDPLEESKFASFLFLLTEPIILPIRRLCQKMHWFEGGPFDMPFLFTVLILTLLQFLLSAL